MMFTISLYFDSLLNLFANFPFKEIFLTFSILINFINNSLFSYFAKIDNNHFSLF